MQGTFSLPLCGSDPNMHHSTCVTHVRWCMLGSLTNGFIWNWWWEKCSWHSQRIHNPQFHVSGKRPKMRYELSAVNSKPDWCSNIVIVFNIIIMLDHVIRTPIHNLIFIDLENVHLKSHCVMKYNTNCFCENMDVFDYEGFNHLPSQTTFVHISSQFLE